MGFAPFWYAARFIVIYLSASTSPRVLGNLSQSKWLISHIETVDIALAPL